MVSRGVFEAIFLLLFLSLACGGHGTRARQLELTLEDDFNDFNLSLWKHEITLGGGGNWEFEYYTNNRTSSYVKEGVLYIKVLLA